MKRKLMTISKIGSVVFFVCMAILVILGIVNDGEEIELPFILGLTLVISGVIFAVSIVVYFILDMVKEIRYRKQSPVIEFVVEIAVTGLVFACIRHFLGKEEFQWSYCFITAGVVSIADRAFRYVNEFKKQKLNER